MTSATRIIRAITVACLYFSGASELLAQQQPAKVQPPPPLATAVPTSNAGAARVVASNASQQITREGIKIEFSIEPVKRDGELREETDAVVRFIVTDTTTGQPVTNLRPAAWLDRRKEGTAATLDAKACREKVQTFLQAQLSRRPDIDLNSYYVLALNEEANISVIDPLSGFGSSKLLTLIALKTPGADWVLGGDRKKLFVSMPLANAVAVVDTSTWKVIANIETGAKPVRLRLQNDGKYLWVTTDGAGDATAAAGGVAAAGNGVAVAGGGMTTAGGVTVIDAATGTVTARINTGAGHHEIALSPDDRYAFVSNETDGTLSVIDAARLAKVKDLKTGARPTALAFSPLGRAVYVAHAGDGSIVVVDAVRGEIAARLQAEPGLVAIRFSPDGRYGFAVNQKESVVHIFDAASNRLLHRIAVGKSPDQVTFTRQFAYVRALASEQVSLINLTQLGKAGTESAAARFPGGQKSPELAASRAVADSVVPSAEEDSVLVANPADKMIYFYQEGMAAPMGSFSNYKREPKSVLVWDASLRESAPGVYATNVLLTGQGNYDVPFLLDAPRVVNCFEMSVKENPALQQKREVAAIKIESLLKDESLKVGETVRLRFKVTDAATGAPRADLKDIGVLAFLAPGIWQQRDWAKSLGAGVYEISFVPPQTGVYYLFFQCPSLGVEFKQTPPLILQAADAHTSTNAP